jgi:hypothetical protein
VTVKGFKTCCILNAVDGTDDDKQWNDSKEDKNARSVRMMKALTVKMEIVKVDIILHATCIKWCS